MDGDAAALAAAIGARVRRERQARRWTLDHLAEAAGVSRRMLVNVEQGGVNPSVGTLLRLSDALGLGLPTLVEPPTPRSVTVTRDGEGATLWTGEHGGRGVLVAGTRAPDVVELWDWTLAPGERHDSEAHAPGTKELLQVRQGTVIVEVAGQEYRLGAGDAVTFPGDVAHGYRHDAAGSHGAGSDGAGSDGAGSHSARAGGTGPARFSLAVFEPGVGSAIHPSPATPTHEEHP